MHQVDGVGAIAERDQGASGQQTRDGAESRRGVAQEDRRHRQHGHRGHGTRVGADAHQAEEHEDAQAQARPQPSHVDVARPQTRCSRGDRRSESELPDPGAGVEVDRAIGRRRSDQPGQRGHRQNREGHRHHATHRPAGTRGDHRAHRHEDRPQQEDLPLHRHGPQVLQR